MEGNPHPAFGRELLSSDYCCSAGEVAPGIVNSGVSGYQSMN